MCAADLSIKVPKLPSGPMKVPNIYNNVWGTQHQCRSWSAVLNWLASCESAVTTVNLEDDAAK
ncbi:hypothetical protein AC578_3665 [Pseudocercospora eumusae]|uniref:Uncharacterized protein n=1 Tax=Pseudocercospora eumusae TaxID=321146 RepID=A0A139GXA9_9PEZI|nr:hypothetical protein AC578_3665 [Pseudocercospora eumusae]KXS94837.1 hypothetical protein AC578_3665 [Pseudocercospora eumusae]KXS94838.1 hypothetical protein AC578_3665 [Pseudocercospora eumusae]